MFTDLWQIHLFGSLSARRGGRTITRFRTGTTGSLLAYLCYFLLRPHSREELVEQFWPEADEEAGRASLRTALSSLRRQLEPADIEAGAVLVADRTIIRLNPDAVTTDVHAFETGDGSGRKIHGGRQHSNIGRLA